MLLFSLSHFNYQYYSFKYISYYHVVVSPSFPPNCMYRNAYGQKLLYAEFMRAMFQEGDMRNAEALVSQLSPTPVVRFHVPVLFIRTVHG